MTTLALILAGGKGNRFWPKSSPSLPKQFLQLMGTETLLQATVKRVKRLVEPRHIFIITGARYANLVREQVPDIPGENVLVEPMGRDTAPAVVYSCHWLQGKYGEEAVLITLPADHYVAEEDLWLQALQTAVRTVDSRGCPVLIGTIPKRLEPSYGYIIPGDIPRGTGESVRVVKEFVEKPDLQLAQELVHERKALWNSGMFVWKIAHVFALVRQYQPELAQGMEEVIREMKGAGLEPHRQDIPPRIAGLFGALKPVSVDYGLLEPCGDLAVVVADFHWDDLGNWQALERLQPLDSHGNVRNGNGNISLTDTENCIIQWEEGPAIIAGLKDSVVVGHNGQLLVCHKAYLPQLKSLLRELAEPDQEPSPSLKTVGKPWGKEIWWAVTPKYAAKILEIRAGYKTSLHLHEKKLETFYVEKGRGKMALAENIQELFPGQVLTVAPGTAHRIMAESDLRLFEVSTTELDDVIRLEDDYGRAD